MDILPSSRRPSTVSISSVTSASSVYSTTSDATVDASTGLPRRRSSVYDSTVFENVISPMVDLFPSPPASANGSPVKNSRASPTTSPSYSNPQGPSLGSLLNVPTSPSPDSPQSLMRLSPIQRGRGILPLALPIPVVFAPPMTASRNRFVPSRTPPLPPSRPLPTLPPPAVPTTESRSAKISSTKSSTSTLSQPQPT